MGGGRVYQQQEAHGPAGVDSLGRFVALVQIATGAAVPMLSSQIMRLVILVDFVLLPSPYCQSDI